MEIVILSNETIDGVRGLVLTNGRRTVEIAISKVLTAVVVKNAAHAAYRGYGRTFHGDNTLAQARDSYKDASVKSLIQAAIDLTK